MAPKSNNITKIWEVASDEAVDNDEACGSAGRLIRQGPVSFFKRLADFYLYQYDRMVLKYNICTMINVGGW